MQVVLWQDAASRFVQVYSGTRKALGESAIAIEAMSSAADAWNNMQGVHVNPALENGQIQAMTIAFTQEHRKVKGEPVVCGDEQGRPHVRQS